MKDTEWLKAEIAKIEASLQVKMQQAIMTQNNLNRLKMQIDQQTGYLQALYEVSETKPKQPKPKRRKK